jgi:hypothetical protein
LKIAILTRPGGCFPNIISLGLADMLHQLNIESEIFYEIPFLMRLLPFSEKPMRWTNSFHYRLLNKIKNYRHDQRLLKRLSEFDCLIVSECLPNALWKNYLAVEELKKRTKKKIGSYSDGSINVAPRHKKMLLNESDYGDGRFDFNFFVSRTIEQKLLENNSNKGVIGLNISNAKLKPGKKHEFIAIVDFAQKGYEFYREQQVAVLQKLGIKTIILEGKYELEEIRNIYRKASVFFISFPETFGLPIAECLACGAFIFTPSSMWPMAWRLDDAPASWEQGILPGCFNVYNDEDDLTTQLENLRSSYDLVQTPQFVFDTFINNYRSFYYGDVQALKKVLDNNYN